MNIKERMKGIKGVVDVYWNPSNLSLSIYHNNQFLDELKLKVTAEIDKANLHRAIENINFYSL